MDDISCQVPCSSSNDVILVPVEGALDLRELF